MNHTYFVLEKHTKKESDNNEIRQFGNEQGLYGLSNNSSYEDTNVIQDDDYDTTVQRKCPALHPGKPGNVYNTFNDFQQQDDYDHLADHKKKQPKATDNEYSTTQAVMSPATDDDTYNHLHQGPKTTAGPDNLYGMPRVDDHYDRMPTVSGTKTTYDITGDDAYSKIGKFQ